jgi:hypothetical protein
MKKLLLSILAVFLLVEEWLWDVLTAFGHRLFIWLHLAGFERWLAGTRPGVAMAAMVLPMLLILPVKIAALFLFAHGQIIQGLILVIAAKLFATLLVSRMFAVTRPQLMTFAWFATLYTTITRWLAWAHERIRATPLYQQAVKLKAAARARWAKWRMAGE